MHKLRPVSSSSCRSYLSPLTSEIEFPCAPPWLMWPYEVAQTKYVMCGITAGFDKSAWPVCAAVPMLHIRWHFIVHFVCAYQDEVVAFYRKGWRSLMYESRSYKHSCCRKDLFLKSICVQIPRGILFYLFVYLFILKSGGALDKNFRRIVWKYPVMPPLMLPSFTGADQRAFVE